MTMRSLWSQASFEQTYWRNIILLQFIEFIHVAIIKKIIISIFTNFKLYLFFIYLRLCMTHTFSTIFAEDFNCIITRINTCQQFAQLINLLKVKTMLLYKFKWFNGHCKSIIYEINPNTISLYVSRPTVMLTLY